MNTVGSYDGIDMHGLRPAWYEPVDAVVQERIIAAFPQHRVLWNDFLMTHTVVQREPGYAQQFKTDEWMDGWFICLHWDGTLGSGDGLIAQLRGLDRWRKWKREKDPENRTLDLEAEMLAERDRRWERDRKGLDEAVDRWLEPVHTGLLTPAQFAARIRAEEAREMDETSRAHSHGRLVVPVPAMPEGLR